MKVRYYKNIITQALLEDAAENDITTNLLVESHKLSEANILSKENAVICGLDIAKAVFKKLDKNINIQSHFKDGDSVKKNDVILHMKGKTRAILTGERTALNFLGYLSGISTNTNNFVNKVYPLKTKILDTRKTTPGMRRLEKYAVRCGGGTNHRINLIELVLIKDNHREVASHFACLSETVNFFKKRTKKQIEIEVDTFNQLRQALKADPDMILLDNMKPAQLKKAVSLVHEIKKGKKIPLLEASGGVTLKNVRTIAKTGVDLISIGSLTHTHRFIDLSMEVIG
jgi:nicotinate-nucleotide pyrophosphorylase (carboxylating)